MDFTYLPLFSFLSVAVITVFTFVSVVVYITHRRQEREAFYRAEMLKKLAEAEGGAQAVLDAMQLEGRRRMRQVREGTKLGGLVCTGVGIGLIGFFYSVQNARPVGYIPLSVGLALLLYSLVLAPKDEVR